jgi:hypothetical protein
MTEGEVVEARRGDLVGREDDLVAIGLAGDGDGAVDHADVPGRDRCRGHGSGDIPERAVRRPLRLEDRADDEGVDRRQVDEWVARVEHGDQAVIGRRAGQRGEVVRAIDGGAIEHVVRARDDDGPDPRVGEPLQLRGHPLDGTARLDVRVEQVARDQEQVDLLGDGEIHGRPECRELSLALGRRLLAQVVMTGAEMHVRGMDDPEHRGAACLLASDG